MLISVASKGSKRLSVPVLFCIFNRPKQTEQSFQRIRESRPSELFISADGPRTGRGEDSLCEAARSIVKKVDWPCTVHTLFREENLGCRLAMSTGIGWFFEHVEEGIVLEDDCIADPTFFTYCSNLLERYRDDRRVWCISGSNFQNGQWRGDGSYYFSRYNHCWGWATWRRCWRHYDSELMQWGTLKKSGLLSTIFDTELECTYWSGIWDRLLLESKPDSWAYRWTFTCFSQGGLTALPNRNLVSNIGVGSDATHCAGYAIDTVVNEGLPAIVHPAFELRDALADQYTFKNVFLPVSEFNPSTRRLLIRRNLSALKKRLVDMFRISTL